MASDAQGGGGGQSPLAQFEIKPLIDIHLGGLDISFTNSSLFMVLAVLVVSVFLIIGAGRGAIVPGRWQAAAEGVYEFIANLLRDTVGEQGRKYFPIIFTLFMFILAGNMLGMLPYSFTFTSHIIVTLAMALVVFIGVTLLGLVKHGTHFFSLFVPPGTPIFMMPLLVPIEVISYFSRPVSLSVRLFANMLAGHTLLKVLALFVPAMGMIAGVVPIGGILPLALITALTGLEILIAFLQAYVFAILTCLYINDALHLH